MPITTNLLHRHFAADVGGVDLVADMTDSRTEALRQAFDEHSVLVFRHQQIDDDQQIAFSRRFGPMETDNRRYAGAAMLLAFSRGENKGPPGSFVLSNVDHDGNIIPPDDARMVMAKYNQLWHTDSSFKPVPALASLLFAIEVPPERGETEFACLRAAYEALDENRKDELEDIVAEHSIVYSRSLLGSGSIFMYSEEEAARLPPVQHPVVRTNPVNGRKALYLGSHASHIVGRPVEEGRALLTELLEFATRPEFVYQHKWRRGDLVMWDNRCVLHRGRPFDAARHRRVMRQTKVAGARPTVGPDATP